MLVQVDEAGGDDVAGRVDDARALERSRRHRFDHPAADADVAHGVEPRFGIHDAAVGDDQVVRRGRGRRRAGRGNQECSDRDESVSTGHGRAG